MGYIDIKFSHKQLPDWFIEPLHALSINVVEQTGQFQMFSVNVTHELGLRLGLPGSVIVYGPGGFIQIVVEEKKKKED